MQKKIFISALFLSTLMTAPAFAGVRYGGYEEQYDRKENRDHHKIAHGYYPYYFSNQARSRYSYSAEEKGHYIYGATDKPWPFSKNKHQMSISMGDDGVLISRTPPEQLKALDEKLSKMMEEAKKKNRPGQVNDSRDLQKIVDRHKWEYSSPEFRKAVEKDPDNVKADPINYEKLFQQE